MKKIDYAVWKIILTGLGKNDEEVENTSSPLQNGLVSVVSEQLVRFHILPREQQC